MAQFLTAGTRKTLTPEGRLIVQVPVSTTDDVNAQVPSAPSGTRLTSIEYTHRTDGGRDYVFSFESISPNANNKQQEVNGQCAQEPIETHPKFNGQNGGGLVSDADLAAIKKSLSDGSTPTFKTSGVNKAAAENLYKLMLKGVTHYYTPSGITYSETSDETTKPNLRELATIDRPPSDAPALSAKANWLQIGLRAQKIYEPESGNSFWRVSREWLASGPRGWNADFDIY